MKKISKVTVYFTDGTYEDVFQSPELSFPTIPTPTTDPFKPISPNPFGPRCSKCGIDTSYPTVCSRTDCPSGLSPWPPFTAVQD